MPPDRPVGTGCPHGVVPPPSAATTGVQPATHDDVAAFAGHGDVPWEARFRVLDIIGSSGGRSRWSGIVRRLAFDPPAASFDAAFASGN